MVGAARGSVPRISVRVLDHPIDRRIAAASLGPGESEALSLALEMGRAQILVDEHQARRLAGRLDIPVIGTVGVLVAAKHLGVLTEIRPTVDAILATGFFLSPDVYDDGLRLAGESAG